MRVSGEGSEAGGVPALYLSAQMRNLCQNCSPNLNQHSDGIFQIADYQKRRKSVGKTAYA
jgi:hypothetical protein